MERLWAILVKLYPADYRAAYAEQMRLTLRDAWRETPRRKEAGSAIVFLFATLADLLVSALAERVRQVGGNMSRAKLMALAGPLHLVAGVLWVISSLGEFVLLSGLGSRDSFWDAFWLLPLLISFPILLLALIGAYGRLRVAAGTLGRIGIALSIAGCGGLLLLFLVALLLGIFAPAFQQDIWANRILATCFVAVTTGYLLFGVNSVRRSLLPRWNVAPILIGVIALLRFAPGWLDLPNYHTFQLGAYFLHLSLTGVCLILIGIAMTERRDAPLQLPA